MLPRMPDKNLTLRIDEQVLLWARMRALRDGTSINRRIRQYLDEYAAIPPGQRWEHLLPAWPEVDPGEAGKPGGPPDHSHLAGRDGHVMSPLRALTHGDPRLRRRRLRGR